MLKPFDDQSPRLSQDPGWDDTLRLGYCEVDAFYHSRWTAETGWDGRLHEHRGAMLELSPAACALHYGQALFEGLKARRTQDGRIVLFRPDDNGRRMRASAARLVMEPPPVADF